MVVNNTLQLKLFRRKGIHYTYIQLYTATSREEFFQYMFILYYFFKAMRCGRGGGGQICLFSPYSSVHVLKQSLSTKFCR